MRGAQVGSGRGTRSLKDASERSEASHANGASRRSGERESVSGARGRSPRMREDSYVIDRNRTNAFEFVIVAGARAKQLLRGCTPRTATTVTEKLGKVAQRGVREGKVERVIETK
jgi:DNA-directed RNA polymerase subunit K/omega